MVKRKEEKEIMIYEIIHTNLKIEQTPTQQKHGETHVHVEGRDFPGWSTRCTRCVALATNPAQCLPIAFHESISLLIILFINFILFTFDKIVYVNHSHPPVINI
jgi:hypothetical protein